MKALMFLSPGASLTLQEVPIPPLQPDQLLVCIRSAGICGTDLHFYQHDELAKGKALRYPYILGHEMAGEVIEVGKNVARFAAAATESPMKPVASRIFFLSSAPPSIGHGSGDREKDASLRRQLDSSEGERKTGTKIVS